MELQNSSPEKQNGNSDKESIHKMLEKIEVFPGFYIPAALAMHWPEIEKTKRSYISISATPTGDLSLTQSKFGHYPYMPLDFEYPKDAEDRYMFPLAQINCNELPALEGYPASGYLQFYISAFDDLYGANFDDRLSQRYFRVLYFENQQVEKCKTDFAFLNEVMKSDSVPVDKPHSLSFSLKEEYVGICDVNNSFDVWDIFAKYPDIETELGRMAYEFIWPIGHKIGGYSYFKQTDPRLDDDQIKDYILLLQIDSDDEIQWGDMGVGNFFIHPDYLVKKDFSRVMYTWDSY
jgi:uncharacterized protein YwqG